MNDTEKIGKVIKSGKDGLVISLETNNIDHYKTLELVFVHHGREPIPFYITSIRVKSKTSLEMRLDGITESQANLICGSDISLKRSDILPEDLETSIHASLVGYQVIDKKTREAGTVVAFIERPLQPLIEIDAEGKSYMIPFTDEIIRKVDHRKRRIFTDLPDGLTEI